MKAPLSYVPVLPATSGVVAGILIHDVCGWTIPLAASIAAFVILYWRRQHYLSFWALFTAMGIIIAASHTPNTLPKGLFDGKHTVQGTIESVKETANATTYTVGIDNIDGIKIDKIRCQTTVLAVSDVKPQGSYICINGSFEPIQPHIDVPYETDYDKYLKDTGVQCKCIVRPYAITLIRRPDWWHSTVNNVRDCIFNAIVTSGLDGRTAGFLVAVILGDRQFLPTADYSNYRRSGVAHILALSGMHIGILAMLITCILFPLQGSIRGQKARSIITMVLIWGYAVVVGFTPSIVRAAVMLTVFDVTWFIQRGYSAFNSLLLSVLIILCINPSWLYAPGLQLSVCAVASILALCWLMPKKLRRHKAAYYLVNMVSIPIAAMMGTGMVSVYYFGVFPLMFLIGNIVTGVLLPWILTGGTLIMLLNMCGIDFSLLCSIVDGLYHSMDSAIAWLAGIDGGVADGLFINGWALIPYFLFLALLVLSVKHMRNLRLWMSCIICGEVTLIVLMLPTADIPAAELYMTRTQTTRMIMRHGAGALLWSDSKDKDNEISECNVRYAKFLQSRHCGETFMPLNSVNDSHTFCRISDRTIAAVDRIICMVYDDTIPKLSGTNASYTIICKGYRGDVKSIVEATRPDTIVLAANMHPRVRQRIVRECADTIPYIDIRDNPLRIIWK